MLLALSNLRLVLTVFLLEYLMWNSNNPCQYLERSWLSTGLGRGRGCDEVRYFLICATIKYLTPCTGCRATKIEEPSPLRKNKIVISCPRSTFRGGSHTISKSSLLTRLKIKIENNSTWEGAFYQSEWVKMNSSWVILVFSLYVCCC